MQKVTAHLPSFSWDKTKTNSKKGFDKVWGWADKLGAPVNRLTNKIGSEAFWPTTLDKECDKAARILRSFCKDGFYTQEDRPTTEGPTQKARVLKKIPQKVIQNAVGLAIFTTMRTGLWISGAGGSGVLIARKEDGTWSPPSGILLHTAGLGFLVGVDIYDCVVVINNRKALDAFTKIRATLGGEISAVAGPVGVGGVLENDGKWKQVNRPVFTYLKSRGFYAGVQVDGTVIIERTDENERFYGERIGVADILAGKARHPPYEIKMLMETVKAAEGRTDIDQELMEELADQPAPGDVGIESPTRQEYEGPIFGLPEPDDPDPFGVLALEKAGLEIKEAGSGARPSSDQFEYRPSPTSPIFSKFHRLSMETLASKSNRGSYMSHRTRASTDRATQTTEAGIQTDTEDALTPGTSPSLSNGHHNIIEEETMVKEPEEIDYTKIDLGPYSDLDHSAASQIRSSGNTVTEQDKEIISHSIRSPERLSKEHDRHASYTSDDDGEADDEDDEPVVFEVAAVHTPGASSLRPQIQVVQARGSIVDIPKRVPPPLPPRNPFRASGTSDQASGRSPTPSPTKDGFEEAELGGSTRVASVDEVLSPEPLSKDDLEHVITLGSEDSQEKGRFLNGSISDSMDTPVVEISDGDLKRDEEIDHKIAENKKWLEAHQHPHGDAEESDDFHSIPTTPA